MGALIQGKFIQAYVPVKEPDNKTYENELGVKFTQKLEKKNIYKTGVITKVGRIFAELPIDIKYSRLIMISYALGEIDLGITLAAILSQDRSIFLNSDKCNRYNLYKVKDYYSFQKECDFIASYTAYRKWYYYYGHFLINENVKFDTQLRNVDKKTYSEIMLIPYSYKKIII
jgi:HrpA-like RNA helicase